MNKNKGIIWLPVAGLTVFLAGCSKSDNAAPSPVAAEKVAAPESKPVAPAAQQTPPPAPVIPTNASTTRSVEQVAKLADTAPPAINAALPKASDNSSAAPALASSPSSSAAPTLASLSQDQVVRGLQEALGKGLQQAIAGLGHDGGFLTNLNVKIPMPEQLQKVESTLRAMKQDKLADDFVATMNHAAEQAVPQAGTVFADALQQMTIEDAKSILTGPSNAATQYFQRTTQTNLYARFYPIVQQATQKTGVTAAYKRIMEKADLADVTQITQKLGNLGSALGNALPAKPPLDLDAYVTNKAMDGLFKMVADEEKQIRQNPVARTTDLLQKVFGALKK